MKRKFLSTVICFALMISVLFILSSCGEKEFEGLSFSDETFVYDGFEHSISVLGAPAEAEITYSPTNIQITGGTYLITATVAAENYKTATLTATLNIVYPEDYALDSDIAALIAALANATAANDAKIAALKSEYQAALDELNAEYLEKVDNILDATEASDAILDLTGKVADLIAADEETASLITELTDKVTALQTADETTASAIEDLATKVNALIAANEATASAIADLTDEICALQTAVDANTSAIAALQGAGATNSDRIAELEEKVALLLEVIKHTVSFDLGGAEGDVAPQIVKHGEKASKPTDPTREGYTFLGWYAEDEVWSFAEDTVTGGITLTARWASTKVLSVTEGYTLENNIITTSPQRYPKDYIDVFSIVRIDALSTATLYKDSELTEAFANGRMDGLVAGVNKAYLVIENEHIPASTYEIVITLVKQSDFYSDGVLFDTVTAVNDRIYAPASTPISQNTGYEFDFWAVEGEAVSFPYDFSLNVEFEAVFKPITYTVTYNTNGGTMPDSYDSEYTILGGITLPVPTRSLYIFDGWYASPSFEGARVTEIATGEHGNKTLYAKWKSATGGVLLELSQSGDYYTVTGYEGTDTAVVIPEYVGGIPVTSIGDIAFSGCTSFTSVTIPDSVTRIGIAAFYGHASLTSIKYLGTEAEWNEISKGEGWDTGTGSYTVTYNGQDGDDNIPGDDNAGGNETEGTDGVVYTLSGDGTYAIVTGYSGSEANVVIKDTYMGVAVTHIGELAFYQCYSLRSITIHRSITSIGNSAFAYCTSLLSIKYRGTQAEWTNISKVNGWNDGTTGYTVTYNYNET